MSEFQWKYFCARFPVDSLRDLRDTCKGDEYIPSASVRTFRLAEKVTGKWGRLSADALRERFNETFTRAEAMETMRLAEAIPSYHTPSSWFARMVEAKRIVEAATT